MHFKDCSIYPCFSAVVLETEERGEEAERQKNTLFMKWSWLSAP